MLLCCRADVARAIKEKREAKGLSQKQLAKEINIDPSRLCRWELGENEPGGLALIKLFSFLGLKVKDFYSVKGSNND